MSGFAIALPRRGRRRRRRPRGFEWFTLLCFAKGVAMAMLTAAYGIYAATALFGLLSVVAWPDRVDEQEPTLRNGTRTIIVAWFWGVPD